MFKLVTLVAASLICGCASHNTVLTNDAGLTRTCNAMGFGIVSSIVATSVHANCVEEARAKGFK